MTMDKTTGSPSSKLEACMTSLFSLKEVSRLQKQSFLPIKNCIQAITQLYRRAYFELGLPLMKQP